MSAGVKNEWFLPLNPVTYPALRSSLGMSVGGRSPG